MRFFSTYFFFAITPFFVFGQMINDDEISFGDEWMNEGEVYYKFSVDQDGIYKITYEDALSNGIPVNTIEGKQLYILNMGRQVPIYVSSSQSLGNEDYILLYAEKNRGELDAHLYRNAISDQLNAEYSLYTDQNAYYLGWNDGSDNLRILEKENEYNPNNLPSKERFYLHEEKKVFSDIHFKPTHNGRDFIRYSSYDIGEGFGSKIRKERSIPFSLDHIYYQGSRPMIKARFTGNASNHFIETRINDLILNRYFKNGYGVNEFEFEFNASHLSEDLVVDIAGIKSDNDKHSVSSISITYPRSFNFGNASAFNFKLGKSFIPRYIEIESFDSSGEETLLLDVENQEFYRPILEEGLVKIIIPASINTRDFVLINSSKEIENIDSFKEVSKTIDISTIGNFIIITNDLLTKDVNGIDWAGEYAEYRESVQGGQHKVSVVDIKDLYEQYGYGIEGHSIAIKNFISKVLDDETPLKGVFIIGKGLEYPLLRKKETLNEQVKCFVPTYGSPGGDNLFVSEKNGYVPRVPIGRLAAQSPEEVKNYLSKVKAYERPINHADDESVLWRKKVLHLSGGSADIQDLLFGYLSDMEQVLRTNEFGGEVFTYRKKTADLLQSSQTDEIINIIDDGVSLVTFFGHAAVGTFDFSLEDPSRYNNSGRTPIILSLGCHSGNVHSEGLGLSEDFVLEKDKGAVAFIASSGTAYINPQFHSGMNFYEILGDDTQDKNIGEILVKSISEIGDSELLENITLAEQLTLHGDPLIKMYMSEGPDYVSKYESFGVAPGIVNTTLDSFNFIFQILNRGSYREEDIEVRIQHFKSNGEIYTDKVAVIKAPPFIGSYVVTLPNPGIESVGKNDLFLTIDPNNKTNEFPSIIAEQNNDSFNPNGGDNSYSFFILDNKAKPIYPQRFGILNDQLISVHATSDNGLVPLTNYILQMDTTERFDSPIFTEEELVSDNSVISWEPEIDHLDGAVYYWRLSPNNLENNERKWESSSFIYAPGERDGWNQSHFYQWQKNDYDKMLIDSITRNFSFSKRTWDIRVKNELLDPQDFWVFVNGNPWASLNARQLAPAISVFIWHPQDVLYKNRGSDFGSIRFSPDAFLYKMTSPIDRKNLANLLYGAPDGSRVFIHTILKNEHSDFRIDEWESDKDAIGLDLFEVMKSFGAEKFELLKERGTVPYTYIFDKGLGPVAEDIASNIYETVDLSSIGKSFYEEGKMDAPLIGPVKRFMRLEWQEQKSITDETALYLMGIRPDGSVDTLRRVVNDYDVNLTFIRPDEYPQIKLMFESNDEFDKSAAQLDWWRVYFQDLPDISFDISEVLPSIPDTIESGTPFSLSYGIKNLSEESITEFRVKYIINDQQNEQYIFYSDELSLNGDELIFETFQMEEVLPEGEYKITVLLNDEQNPNERTFENNIGVIQFFIKGDKREPILEVKANDEYISENQTLPSDTEFSISFRTPALKVILDDSEIFSIDITYPSGKIQKVTKDNFQFTPSNDVDNNIAYVHFSPLLNEQGKYKLDVKVSDNEKSFTEKTYSTSFLISNRSFISQTNIYPNPIRAYAQIDIEIDGGELPSDFSVRIYDTSGRNVENISRSEFQNIKTGPNKRSHLWLPRDSNGQYLPSGNYLFTITGNRTGEAVQVNHKVVILNE